MPSYKESKDAIVLQIQARKYDEAMSACDKLLAMDPKDGEIYSYKGLIMFSQESIYTRQEAWASLKHGLKLKLTSKICWHVCGSCHVTDENYEEALKSYKQALKFSPGDANLLQDISYVQIHLRDIQGYRETRRQLPKDLRLSWYAEVLGEYMAGYHSHAANLLEFYFRGYENSLEERNQLGSLLSHLHRKALNDSDFLNLEIQHESLVYHEELARCQLRTKLISDAKKTCLNLLRRNPYNMEYVRNFLFAHFPALYQDEAPPEPEFTWAELKSVRKFQGLPPLKGLPRRKAMSTFRAPKVDENTQADLVDFVFDTWRTPEKSCVYLEMLCYLDGPNLVRHLQRYIRFLASREVCAIFNQLKLVMVQGCEQVGPLFEEAYEGLLAEEPHESRPYVLLSAAAFFDWVGQHEKALSLIDEALELNDSVVDFYLMKGKILKHMHRFQESVDVYEFGRQKDLADRFTNTEAVKSLLRNGQTEAAEKLDELFSNQQASAEEKTDVPAFVAENCWLPLKIAKYAKDPDVALTNLNKIIKQFRSYYTQSYDFHSFCLRRRFCLSYIQLLQLLDEFPQNPLYLEALSSAIEVCLKNQRSTSEYLEPMKVLLRAGVRDVRSLRNAVYVLCEAKLFVHALKVLRMWPKKTGCDKLGLTVFRDYEQFLSQEENLGPAEVAIKECLPKFSPGEWNTPNM